MRHLPSEPARRLVQARVARIARAAAPVVFERLRSVARQARIDYLNNKPAGKGNVAVLEYRSYFGKESHLIDATSRAKGSAPLPLRRSAGGHFEPSVDPVSGRVMDTDAEYKAISELARRLSCAVAERSIGAAYLFTEMQPCHSCANVFEQFQEAFPFVNLAIEFDYRYPFSQDTSEADNI